MSFWGSIQRVGRKFSPFRSAITKARNTAVLNELKNRGLKDILILGVDGLPEIKEAIAATFPKTEYQRCIVHYIRNTLKYVSEKDRKAFAADLKSIYQAQDEKKVLEALNHVTEKGTL